MAASFTSPDKFDLFDDVMGPEEEIIDPELPTFDKTLGSEWIYPSNMPERHYQYSIIRQALFKNTLVSLPTGLGKTFIAAVVMYNFYRWFPTGSACIQLNYSV